MLPSFFSFCLYLIAKNIFSLFLKDKGTSAFSKRPVAVNVHGQDLVSENGEVGIVPLRAVKAEDRET